MIQYFFCKSVPETKDTNKSFTIPPRYNSTRWLTERRAFGHPGPEELDSTAAQAESLFQQDRKMREDEGREFRLACARSRAENERERSERAWKSRNAVQEEYCKENGKNRPFDSYISL